MEIVRWSGSCLTLLFKVLVYLSLPEIWKFQILPYEKFERQNFSPITVLSLNGRWTVSNGKNNITVSANVPGSIYTDLMRAHIINDPYYRFNDVEYRWIGREDWSFSRKFDVDCKTLQKQRVTLVCHGLDTVSKVFINGIFIGRSNNMFVRYIFDIKSALKPGNNTITISFQSPVKYAEEKHSEQSLKYVIPPTCPPPVQHGECHVNYIRKMQSSFSWDWGPSFPTQGIWKNIEIEGYNTAIIRDILVKTTPIDSDNELPVWTLDLKIMFETASSGPVEGIIEVFLENNHLLSEKVNLSADESLNAKLNLHVNLPDTLSIKAWWPNGLGSQSLYLLAVTFEDNLKQEVSSKQVKIGFRTVELVQEKIPESSGLSFYFRVNGVPFFAKGSNWIPADSFPERITTDYLSDLLKSAKDANMNMLRVWGGGIYENEEFYNLADELGIFIWQDLMFAVALYPVDHNFLKSVSTEILQQVRRLQHHSSILLWAGNNENEVAISNTWWPAVSKNLQQYKSDYLKLYITTAMPIITEEDSTRPFVSSSPSNGVKTMKDGWLSSNPQDELFGDVHFYDYSGNAWDWKLYPRPRFASEYGFQSYPSFETFANVSKPSDWVYPSSAFLNHRQHHMLGQEEIILFILNHMSLPSKKCGIHAFKDLLYLSQVSQAMNIKTETEAYRRSQSDVINGKGKTMGALYWQLNDIWQGPSWSSIEYGGKWKILHYYAVHFFSPVLVSPFLDNERINVSVISDEVVHLFNVTLNIEVYHWSSFTPYYSEKKIFHQAPQNSKIIYSATKYGKGGLLSNGQCNNESECFLYFYLNDGNQSLLGPPNFIFLTPLNKASGLEKADIQITGVVGPYASKISNTTFTVSLHTSQIAPFVLLDAVGIQGRFSNNGFLMVDENLKLQFYSKYFQTSTELWKKIKIRSLTDVCTD